MLTTSPSVIRSPHVTLPSHTAFPSPTQVFDRIDSDRDGHINSEELRAAFLLAKPEGVGDSAIKSMMRWTAPNHDGLFSFQEYARVLRITAT